MERYYGPLVPHKEYWNVTFKASKLHLLKAASSVRDEFYAMKFHISIVCGGLKVPLKASECISIRRWSHLS